MGAVESEEELGTCIDCASQAPYRKDGRKLRSHGYIRKKGKHIPLRWPQIWLISKDVRGGVYCFCSGGRVSVEKRKDGAVGPFGVRPEDREGVRLG